MLHALRLKNFRCYERLTWEIPTGGALLLGDNAQGKTSLIEAICVALTLHSPRTSRLQRLARHGSSEFGISLDTDFCTRRILWQPRHLELAVDGVSMRDYSDYLTDAQPVVWLGNRDMALVSGGAENRRDYLDFLGTQWHPEYRAHLLAYRKALKSRNVLLRRPKPQRDALMSYGALLVQHGKQLTLLRRRMLELLIPHVVQHHSRISAGETEGISLFYSPASELSPEEAMDRALEADIQAGFTTTGPHRDDVQLLINGTPAAAYASEGQQRTLAISLILAQAGLLYAETGQAPVLLIDDIFGELDPHRRQALLRDLPPESQSLITTTHLHWLEKAPMPLPVCRISNASVQ